MGKPGKRRRKGRPSVRPPTPHDNGRRSSILSFVLGAIAVGALTYAGYALTLPAEAMLTGTLRVNGTVYVTPQTGQIKSFSPGCGCMGQEITRGLGTVTRALAVAVSKTANEWSNFLLVSPSPVSLNALPGLLFDVTVFRIKAEVIDGGINSPLRELDLLPNDESDVIERIELRELAWMNLRSLGDRVSLVQSGEVPFAVWNSAGTSILRMERKNEGKFLFLGEYFHGGENLEDAPALGRPAPKEPRPRNEGKHSIDEFPMLDVIGAPIILWSENATDILVNDDVDWPKSRTVLKFRPTPIDDGKPAKKKEIVALVLRPAYAMRLISLPPQTKFFRNSSYFDYISTENARAAIFTLMVSTANNATEIAGATAIVSKKKVTFSEHVLSISDKFREPVFPWIPRMANKTVPFQQPKLPTNSGFTLYGELYGLSLSNAKGDLLADSYPISIGAPGELLFSGLSDVEPNMGTITFLSDGNLEFRANVKQMYLNADALYTNAEKFRRFIAILGLLAGFTFVVTIAYRLAKRPNRTG